MLALLITQPEESAASEMCHRHLARGQRVPAAATRVPIDLEVLVIAPDLCRACLDDVDSWLRLFGIREEEEEHEPDATAGDSS
jgi:hypothetical protein